MKKIFTTLILLLTTFAFAEDAAMPPRKKEIIESIPHVWLSGDFLLLKAKEERLAFANQTASTTTPSFVNHRLNNPHFEWNSGVRLNAGYQPKVWTYFGEWTFLESKAHGDQFTNQGSGFFPVQSLAPDLISSNYVTSATQSWRLNYNTINLGAIYPWRIASPLLIKIHASLKTAFFDQKMNVAYGGGFFHQGIDTLQAVNTYFGMGPALGIMPCISLGGGFSIIGDISGSLLGGRFFVKQSETYLNQSLYYRSHFIPKIAWTFDAKAALGYQFEILYKAIVISTQIGWEWHQLYDQNHLAQSQFMLFNENKNLTLQGAFLSLALGF